MSHSFVPWVINFPSLFIFVWKRTLHYILVFLHKIRILEWKVKSSDDVNPEGKCNKKDNVKRNNVKKDHVKRYFILFWQHDELKALGDVTIKRRCVSRASGPMCYLIFDSTYWYLFSWISRSFTVEESVSSWSISPLSFFSNHITISICSSSSAVSRISFMFVFI